MAQRDADCPPQQKIALTESLRLQIMDFLDNPCTRHIIAGFVNRETATLVTNSWRLARNQQTTRLRCRNGITDATVISRLATHCLSLNDVDLRA